MSGRDESRRDFLGAAVSAPALETWALAGDGFVPAPVNPGLGYEFDYNALYNLLDHVET